MPDKCSTCTVGCPSGETVQTNLTVSKTYGSAGDVELLKKTKGTKLETNVQLLSLEDGTFCLNHALRQRQIFGDQILADSYHALTHGQTDHVPEDLMWALNGYGFVAANGQADNQVHHALLEHEDNKLNVDPSFTMLRILLTDVCNLACDYCKVIKLIDKPDSTPTEKARLEEVIRFFFTNSEPKEPKLIHITGGEPTLFFEQVKFIISMKEKYARPGEFCWFVMGTNAVLIDEKKARYLAEHDVKCIVSMDGPEEIHDVLRFNQGGRGSWKNVDRGIRQLKKAGAEVSLSMVLGKHNILKAKEIIQLFLDEYQPTGMGVNFMKPPTPKQKSYDFLIDEELYANVLYDVHKDFRDQGLFLELIYRHLEPFVKQEYRYHDCGAAGGNNLNIDAKGKIGPCKSFLLMDKLAMQDINAEAYKQTVVEKWRKRSPIYYQHCDGCAARGMCGNGCAYDAYVHTQDEMTIDTRSCKYTKMFNLLFIEDLYAQVRPKEPQPGWWCIPSRQDRLALLGKVRAQPDSLSYSIGHHTHASNQQALPGEVHALADTLDFEEIRILHS